MVHFTVHQTLFARGLFHREARSKTRHPSGAKARVCGGRDGTAEAVPFPRPLGRDGTTEAVPFPRPLVREFLGEN